MEYPFDIHRAAQVPEDPRNWVTQDGEVWKHINAGYNKRPQWLKRTLSKNGGGYLYCEIAGKKWYVHRLVYRAFSGPLTAGMDVCHIDGNPKNNVTCNLLQAERTVNAYHRKLHGTQPDMRGSRHPNAKWTEEDAARVKGAMTSANRDPSGRLSRGERARIAYEQGVHVHLVDAVRKGYWT